MSLSFRRGWETSFLHRSADQGFASACSLKQGCPANFHLPFCQGPPAESCLLNFKHGNPARLQAGLDPPSGVRDWRADRPPGSWGSTSSIYIRLKERALRKEFNALNHPVVPALSVGSGRGFGVCFGSVLLLSSLSLMDSPPSGPCLLDSTDSAKEPICP